MWLIRSLYKSSNKSLALKSNFRSVYLEAIVHALLWIIYFSSVNVNWMSDWFDPSLRPNTPSPLIVLIFPIFFYAHTFFLMPRYFNRPKWKAYLLGIFLVFIVPELIRAILSVKELSYRLIIDEIFSRDSLLFGAPSAFFIAINTSFIYRLIKDKLLSEKKGKPVQTIEQINNDGKEIHSAPLISSEEQDDLAHKLAALFEHDTVYVDSDLSLRKLAEQLETTDKKLSYVLNQKLGTNFNDYINSFRITAFIEAVKDESNKNLSLLGIALNCGFQSKSSFYRAFKKETGKTPKKYFEELSDG